MEIDPEEVSSMYRTLAGGVVPRPIAWVSTTDPEGVDNLAPYSFFNVVTESVAEAMNETSATLPPGESEFDRADLTRADSRMVAPPRVAESPVAFECSLYEMLDVGGSSMVLGEIEWVHVDDEVTSPN